MDDGRTYLLGALSNVPPVGDSGNLSSYFAIDDAKIV